MFTMDLSFVDKASFGVAAREMHTLLAQKMVLQAGWETEENTWSSWIKCFSGRRPLSHLTAAWLWLTQTPQSTRCGPGEACNIGRWISSWLARRAWCRKWFISWTQVLSELRINIVKICRVVQACLSNGFYTLLHASVCQVFSILRILLKHSGFCSKNFQGFFVTQFEADKIWCTRCTLTPGCDSNLQLDDGTTPLHVAAGCGQSECVAWLRGKHHRAKTKCHRIWG